MDAPKRTKEVIKHLRLGMVGSLCSLLMREGLGDKGESGDTRNPSPLGRDVEDSAQHPYLPMKKLRPISPLPGSPVF